MIAKDCKFSFFSRSSCFSGIKTSCQSFSWFRRYFSAYFNITSCVVSGIIFRISLNIKLQILKHSCR
nr:MAG TPA: hypothetical protein [Caudoviricetes sp.]